MLRKSRPYWVPGLLAVVIAFQALNLIELRKLNREVGFLPQSLRIILCGDMTPCQVSVRN